MRTAPVLSVILFSCLLSVVLSLARRLWMRFSLVSVYVASFLVFCIVGLIFLALTPALAQSLFPMFALHLLTPDEVAKAMWLAGLGLTMTLGVYWFFDQWLYAGGVTSPPGHQALAGSRRDLNVLRVQIVLASVLAITVILIMGMIQRVGPQTIVQSLGGSLSAGLEGRRQVASSYLFVVWSFNILPFTVAVAYLCLGRSPRRPFFSSLVGIGIGLTFLMSLLTFQKRPFVVFLGMLALAHWLGRAV